MQHSPTDPGKGQRPRHCVGDRTNRLTLAHRKTASTSRSSRQCHRHRDHSLQFTIRQPPITNSAPPHPPIRISESGHAAPFGREHGHRLPSLGGELPESLTTESLITESLITVTHPTHALGLRHRPSSRLASLAESIRLPCSSRSQQTLTAPWSRGGSAGWPRGRRPRRRRRRGRRP